MCFELTMVLFLWIIVYWLIDCVFVKIGSLLLFSFFSEIIKLGLVNLGTANWGFLIGLTKLFWFCIFVHCVVLSKSKHLFMLILSFFLLCFVICLMISVKRLVWLRKFWIKIGIWREAIVISTLAEICKRKGDLWKGQPFFPSSAREETCRILDSFQT